MGKLTHEDVERIGKKNLKYKESVGWNIGEVAKLLGLRFCPSPESKDFIRAVKKFQEGKGLKVDGIVGPKTFSYLERNGMTKRERLIAELFDKVVAFESGGRPDAINPDDEFHGRVNRRWNRIHGHDHPATNTSHIGVSIGWGQATQDGGSAGKLLQKMAKKNPEKFRMYMGPTSEEFLDVFTRPGPAGFPRRVLRGPRVQKIPVKWKGEVERRDAWQEPWLTRLRNLLRDTEFRQTQREFFFDHYFDVKKCRGYLKEHNLLSEKAAAIAFNRSIHAGQSKVDNLFDPCLDRGDEKDILKCVANRYHRAEDIYHDDDLSFDRWEGWDYI